MISLWHYLIKNGTTKRAGHWALAAAMLTTCSCSSAPRPVAKSASDPFLKAESPAIAAAEPEPRATPRPHATAYRERMIQQVGGEYGPTTVDGQTEGAIVRNGAELRMPDDPNCPCPVAEDSPCTSAAEYPDEYLCDGGDRDLPISYSESEMQGLETEDAAVEYVDDLDKRHVKATNRVCIYAPRFASISSVSEPIEDVGSGRPVQTIANQLGIGLENREGTFAQHQRDATERLVTRERGSAMLSGAAAESVEQPTSPAAHAHTAAIAEDFTFLRTGQVHQVDEARLATSIKSALVLSRDQNPVITAKSEQGIELRSTFMQRELVGQENRNRGHGKLRVVKLADRQIAQSGDIVTFTIHYDNVGDREVRDVVIIDNLTPRLEYVDDSAECDAPGHLDLEDNGEGSLILRWVLDDPVPRRKGGVVSFQARVR